MARRRIRAQRRQKRPKKRTRKSPLKRKRGSKDRKIVQERYSYQRVFKPKEEKD